jgi:conjugative relaxase-like TrwC/TraI family protein
VFRQHTSRKLDPQLHTHAVIANRVPAPDGRWLALDARTIKLDQRTYPLSITPTCEQR